jgi:hypothetical protein
MYGTADRRPRKPSWGALYALATLMLGLLGVIDVLVPPGVWCRTIEIVITVAAFGAIHLWVRANRRALDLAGERNAGFRRVIESSGELERGRRRAIIGASLPGLTRAKTAPTHDKQRAAVVALPRRSRPVVVS